MSSPTRCRYGHEAQPLRRRIAALGLVPTTAMFGLAAALLGPAPGASAQPKRPDPPKPPVTIYQPDEQGCRPELIEAGFRRNLQPFADQSEAVLAQLRQLQQDLTAASIRRCHDKGLLTAAEAEALSRRLGLAQPATRP